MKLFRIANNSEFLDCFSAVFEDGDKRKSEISVYLDGSVRFIIVDNVCYCNSHEELKRDEWEFAVIGDVVIVEASAAEMEDHYRRFMIRWLSTFVDGELMGEYT